MKGVIMKNIKSPASDRIKAEVKYEKVSFWCWQVFVAVSLFAFVTCIFSIGGFLWEVVRLDLGL